MKQVHDGILHSNVSLVGKLQGVQSFLQQGSERSQHKPFQDLQYVKSMTQVSHSKHWGSYFKYTGTTQEVFHITRMCVVDSLQLVCACLEDTWLISSGPAALPAWSLFNCLYTLSEGILIDIRALECRGRFNIGVQSHSLTVICFGLHHLLFTSKASPLAFHLCSPQLLHCS